MKRHYKPNQVKQSSSPPPQLQLAVAIAQYIDEHGDGVREKTIESYRYFTGRVLIAAKKSGLDQKLVAAITTQDLRDLMKVFSDIGLFPLSTDRTTSRTGKFIRQLFNWFETRQLIKTNPSASLEFKKIGSVSILPFSERDIEAILGHEPATDIDFRDSAAFHLMMDTGMRCSELCALRLNDFDFANRTIQIRTAKRDEFRRLPLGERTVELLDHYIRSIRPAGSDFLFVTEDGAPMTPRNLIKRLTVWAKKSGVAHASTHQFRSTFATQYYQKTGDSRGLRIRLGHTDFTMTDQYIHLSEQEDACRMGFRNSIVDNFYQEPNSVPEIVPSNPPAYSTHAPILAAPDPSSDAMNTLLGMMNMMSTLLQQYIQATQHKPNQS